MNNAELAELAAIVLGLPLVVACSFGATFLFSRMLLAARELDEPLRTTATRVTASLCIVACATSVLSAGIGLYLLHRWLWSLVF